MRSLQKKKSISSDLDKPTSQATNIKKTSIPLSTKDITTIAMMVAIIEACKIVLAAIPNVELTTFLIILFTLHFKRRILYVIPTFILIEGAMYGFGPWWLMYLYSWPLLALITWLWRHTTSALSWSILSGIFGLCFGALCSIPYFIIGTIGEGIKSGLATGFAWWVAGIPFDLIHGIANFVIMLVLYHPMNSVLAKCEKMFA